MGIDSPIANSLEYTQTDDRKVRVTLTNQLIRLLSEQLYQSPLKAIEELVVNSYDADASVCRISVPLSANAEQEFIAVYDDGYGMNYEGLTDLWLIGRSKKRTDEIEKRSTRKQIGKFGIGKLATSTIANQLTYISKSSEGILGVTIDFREFQEKNNSENNKKNNPIEKNNRFLQMGNIEPIFLPVYEIDDWTRFIRDTRLESVLDALDLGTIKPGVDSWTLAILENLKGKAKNIKAGPLKWVLRTAMPLSADFRLFLNGEEILSSKLDYKKLIEFDITELPEERLQGLSDSTGENWHIKGDCIISESFPSGIEGHIFVTEKSLYGQKSDDIQRSHGFFVRVRDRLVDLVDPLFGMEPMRYGILNRFHADIQANDLDKYLTVSRDTVEESDMKEKFRKLLREIIHEADRRFIKKKNDKDKEGSKKEGEKELVAPRLVEEPVADALLTQRYDLKGAEADEGWFYISVHEGVDINQLVQQLYTKPRSKYQYNYSAQGKTNRIVKFDPTESTFWINEEHELAAEYIGDIDSKRLLEDFVTTEMLLEVYLRESHVATELIGEILQRRDSLFRSLAQDRSYSFSMIAQRLRESSSDEHELEINLVVATRALGFNAEQISGSGEPDGIARYIGYPGGPRKITLEAKSSKHDKKRPSEIDFATLRDHTDKHRAVGCLLLAPGYKAGDDDESKVSAIARTEKISCWTVEQLAMIVEAAEARHIGAIDIYEIVTSAFAPIDVTKAIENLLEKPTWSSQDLYMSILEALRKMHGSGIDEIRNVSMVIGAIHGSQEFDDIENRDIRKAFEELAAVSKGALIYDRDKEQFHMTTDIDELERRTSNLTKSGANGRRISSFRN